MPKTSKIAKSAELGKGTFFKGMNERINPSKGGKWGQPKWWFGLGVPIGN